MVTDDIAREDDCCAGYLRHGIRKDYHMPSVKSYGFRHVYPECSLGSKLVEERGVASADVEGDSRPGVT